MARTVGIVGRVFGVGLLAVLGASPAVSGHKELELPAAQGVAPSELAAVSWSLDGGVPAREAVAGEVLLVRVSLRLDPELLEPGRLAAKRTPVDLPVELALPWLGSGADGVADARVDPAWAELAAAGPSTSIVLNGEVGRVLPGTGPGEFGIDFLVALGGAGRVLLEPPALSLERVSATRTGLFGEEQPGDVERVRVVGEAIELSVSEPPLARRPIEWGGAIGELSVEARVSVPVAFEGESLRYELVLRGLANLGEFELPGASAFDKAHLRGYSRTRGTRSETILYDLVPARTGEFELPSVRLATYLPGEGRYEVLSTEPVRVRVLPKVKAGKPDVAAMPEPDSRRAPWWTWPAVGGLFAVAAAFVVARRRRR